MRKVYAASIELEVEVDVECEETDRGNAQAVEAINRYVIAKMPEMVKGAWVAYVESDDDLRGKNKRKAE